MSYHSLKHRLEVPRAGLVNLPVSDNLMQSVLALKRQVEELNIQVAVNPVVWVSQKEMVGCMPPGFRTAKRLRELTASGLIRCGADPKSGRLLYDRRATLAILDKLIGNRGGQHRPE